MNRRSFIGQLVGGLAIGVAARSFPFRVYSFPAQITPATIEEMRELIQRSLVEILTTTPTNIPYTNKGVEQYLGAFLKEHNLKMLPITLEDTMNRVIRLESNPISYLDVKLQLSMVKAHDKRS